MIRPTVSAESLLLNISPTSTNLSTVNENGANVANTKSSELNKELKDSVPIVTAGRKDVKLRSYNGDGNVEQFLAQFHVTAALAKWPIENWGSRFATALDGRVRQMLTMEPLTGKSPFEKLLTLLRSRFGPESSPELWRQSIENRKRGDKKTIAELSHNIFEMTSTAYPALELNIRTTLAVTPFIRALQDEEQRRHVYAYAPRTIEEAVKLSLAFENASKIEHRSYSPAVPTCPVRITTRARSQFIVYVRERSCRTWAKPVGFSRGTGTKKGWEYKVLL